MPGFETELEIERSKTVARWFFIAILAGLLAWQRATQVIVVSPSAFAFLVGGVILVNLLHSVYLFRAQTCPAFYKYLSVGLDLLFLTIAIYFSGGNKSPFFFVFFVLLVSNCIRYGLAMSLYIAVLVNVLYVAALSQVSKKMEPTVLGGEGLKILAVWGTALYGGAVAARVRRQAFEIAAYEETIAELRARLREGDEEA